MLAKNDKKSNKSVEKYQDSYMINNGKPQSQQEYKLISKSNSETINFMAHNDKSHSSTNINVDLINSQLEKNTQSNQNKRRPQSNNVVVNKKTMKLKKENQETLKFNINNDSTKSFTKQNKHALCKNSSFRQKKNNSNIPQSEFDHGNKNEQLEVIEEQKKSAEIDKNLNEILDKLCFFNNNIQSKLEKVDLSKFSNYKINNKNLTFVSLNRNEKVHTNEEKAVQRINNKISLKQGDDFHENSNGYDVKFDSKNSDNNTNLKNYLFDSQNNEKSDTLRNQHLKREKSLRRIEIDDNTFCETKYYMNYPASSDSIVQGKGMSPRELGILSFQKNNQTKLPNMNTMIVKESNKNYEPSMDQIRGNKINFQRNAQSYTNVRNAQKDIIDQELDSTIKGIGYGAGMEEPHIIKHHNGLKINPRNKFARKDSMSQERPSNSSLIFKKSNESNFSISMAMNTTNSVLGNKVHPNSSKLLIKGEKNINPAQTNAEIPSKIKALESTSRQTNNSINTTNNNLNLRIQNGTNDGTEVKSLIESDPQTQDAFSKFLSVQKKSCEQRIEKKTSGQNPNGDKPAFTKLNLGWTKSQKDNDYQLSDIYEESSFNVGSYVKDMNIIPNFNIKISPRNQTEKQEVFSNIWNDKAFEYQKIRNENNQYYYSEELIRSQEIAKAIGQCVKQRNLIYNEKESENLERKIKYQKEKEKEVQLKALSGENAYVIQKKSPSNKIKSLETVLSKNSDSTHTNTFKYRTTDNEYSKNSEDCQILIASKVRLHPKFEKNVFNSKKCEEFISNYSSKPKVITVNHIDDLCSSKGFKMNVRTKSKGKISLHDQPGLNGTRITNSKLKTQKNFSDIFIDKESMCSFEDEKFTKNKSQTNQNKMTTEQVSKLQKNGLKIIKNNPRDLMYIKQIDQANTADKDQERLSQASQMYHNSKFLNFKKEQGLQPKNPSIRNFNDITYKDIVIKEAIVVKELKEGVLRDNKEPPKKTTVDGQTKAAKEQDGATSPSKYKKMNEKQTPEAKNLIAAFQLRNAMISYTFNIFYVNPAVSNTEQKKGQGRFYKFYLSSGNNRELIDKVLAKRWWWSFTANKKDADMYWAQSYSSNYQNSQITFFEKVLEALKSNTCSMFDSKESDTTPAAIKFQNIIVVPKDNEKNLDKNLIENNFQNSEQTNGIRRQTPKTKLKAQENEKLLLERKTDKDLTSFNSIEILSNITEDTMALNYDEKKIIMENVIEHLETNLKGCITKEQFDTMIDTLKNNGYMGLRNFMAKKQDLIFGNFPLKIQNHINGIQNIGHKELLFKNLRAYYEKNNMDIWEVIPRTFLIDAEENLEENLLKMFGSEEFQSINGMDTNHYWIIKPGSNSNQGKGIGIVQGFHNIEEGIKEIEENRKLKSVIIQKYMENPMLYRQRKFDLRCFMVWVIVNGNLKVYWYEDMYLRTSSNIYNLDDVSDVLTHLTNDAIQKVDENYGKFENGNKISMPQMKKYLAKTNPEIDWYDFSLSRVKEISLDIVKCSYNFVNSKPVNAAFEILGLDYMFDELGKPILIEVNYNPALSFSNSIHQKIITDLIEGTVSLVIDPLFPPPTDSGLNKVPSGEELGKFTCMFEHNFGI